LAARQNKKMTHMRKIGFVLFVLGSIPLSNAFSEGCRDKITEMNSVKYGLEHSDIVFLGELINYREDNLTYSFKILELYKGKYKADTIYGHADKQNSVLPTFWGLWIVYAYFNKDSSIDINRCGSTMPMRYAHNFGPPPPPKMYSKDFKSDIELDKRISSIEIYNANLRNWFYDLEKLRNYKNSIIQNGQKRIIDYKLIFLIVSFAFNILMFTIILIKLKNK
jgi:hypothetical protein